MTKLASSSGDTCVRLLQDLIRQPTVNRGTGGEDDGHEHLCASRLADFARDAGLEPKTFAKVKNRDNLVVRLRGSGAKPPLLLNAHTDVVEADAARWTHPPFGGEIHDGYLWGRGAIDMKHMAAMSACVLARLKEEGVPLERDVIFAAVADEEAGCGLGSTYLVDDHPDEVRAEYMLGEVGAFSLNLLGKVFYPVQVAEKGAVWLRATYTGAPGHGSMPDPNSAVVRLAEAIARLGRTRLPMHPVPVVTDFVTRLAASLPFPQSQALKRLTTPQIAGLILDYLVKDPDQRRSFGAMLSSTASPTVVRAGHKVNVIPGRASVEIDGRTLPGQSELAFLAELRELLGPDAEVEVLRSLPAVETDPTTPLYGHLERMLRKHDPLGEPLPYMVVGFTDAKAYARLGTHCYGFAPVKFDPTHEISFQKMYHGHDERVPVDGLAWGLEVLYETVRDFCAPRR
ncbi:MAG: M20/M25/M40 family metallo-hydrolase [Myxococcales bacterium]|jgi:acetylornithine deacetylase/succinyl-diaminopimelate desuccinylase-like protein|nr:M20/M25/M40 family metallo-hydrolase [Myxococcales bacterium]HQY63421.1 M20/M25/M40 family metallo-hydrolase [Polyangiaceae bacterium]